MSDPAVFGLGKISPELFDAIIYHALGAENFRVRVGPQAGTDMALVDMGHGRVMACSTDPLVIRPRLGWRDAARFAVQVIASDVAVSGIAPTAMTVSAVLPDTVPDSDFQALWLGLSEACAQEGIAIVGASLRRAACGAFPVIGAGTVMGFGEANQAVTPAMAREGDVLICTKGAAVQATALIARLYPRQLEGVLDRRELHAAWRLFPEIGVIKDARAAAACGVGPGRVSAMHDATEGGVQGAVFEIASASKLGVEFYADKVKVRPETRKIFAHFGIDPLQTVSEGTLIVAAHPDAAPEVLAALGASGVDAQCIGRLRPLRFGMWKWSGGSREALAHPGPDAYWGLMSSLEAASLP